MFMQYRYTNCLYYYMANNNFFHYFMLIYADIFIINHRKDIFEGKPAIMSIFNIN